MTNSKLISSKLQKKNFLSSEISHKIWNNPLLIFYFSFTPPPNEQLKSEITSQTSKKLALIFLRGFSAKIQTIPLIQFPAAFDPKENSDSTTTNNTNNDLPHWVLEFLIQSPLTNKPHKIAFKHAKAKTLKSQPTSSIIHPPKTVDAKARYADKTKVKGRRNKLYFGFVSRCLNAVRSTWALSSST